MKSLSRFATICFVSMIFALAFEADAASTKATVTPQKQPASVVTADWQQKWDRTVKSAKEEGRLTIFSNVGGNTRADLTKAFKDRHGIDAEFLSAGRGGELTQRLVTERAAGLFTADIIITGSSTIVLTMKPKGIIDSLEPLLILPEVLDKKVWQGGNLFLDKERKLVSLIAVFNRYLERNTQMVSEGELKSFRDLLENKWRGKIVMNDPTVSGTGLSFIELLMNVWGLEQTKEYLTQLVKQMPVMTRDRRLQVEWLARGKYPVCIAGAAEPIANFMSTGSPIAYVITKEGGSFVSGGAVLAVPDHRPHPNAAAVFVNWLLGREGMTVFSKSFGSPSTRLDIPVITRPGYSQPEPGEPAIYSDSEDAVLRKGATENIIKEIFSPILN